MVSSRRGRLRYAVAAAGRTDPPGRRRAGFAMIFALLIAAILWNLGTWWLGLPRRVLAHADRLDHRGRACEPVHGAIGLRHVAVSTGHRPWASVRRCSSSVRWSASSSAALLLLVMKLVIRNKALYEAPTADRPPPSWIRGLLILTCTGVSFAHGSNDGQKGMGLIMLILIGSVPTAYALNRAMPRARSPPFYQATDRAQAVFAAHVSARRRPRSMRPRVIVTACRTGTPDRRPGDLGRRSAR